MVFVGAVLMWSGLKRLVALSNDISRANVKVPMVAGTAQREGLGGL